MLNIRQGAKNLKETLKARILGNRPLSPSRAWKPLVFTSGGFLTLGAEVELQLINPADGTLASRAEELFAIAKDVPGLHQEFYKSTIEIVTGKCANAHEIKKDLDNNIKLLTAHTDALGIQLAGTGAHPFVKALDCEIFPNDRYQKLIDRNQWLTRQMAVYGLHVHIGLRNGDECIRYNNFFLRFIPHLIALSGSSPFWHGEDTGLSSFRPTTYEALPTAGSPYQINTWRDFNTLCESLTNCKAIESLKDLWWDIRPSPNFGTLEIRACDGLASLSETTALVAFIHTLATWFSEHGDWLEQVSRPPHWLMRENKWRAMRWGLDASFVVNPSGEMRQLREELAEWIERLMPYAHRFGYEEMFAQLRRTCEDGNSADRQRRVYAATGSLQDVVAHNCAEFRAQTPLPVK